MDPHILVEQAQALRRAAIDGSEERWDERADLLNRAVRLSRDAGDDSSLADALMAMGQFERDRGDLGPAWRRYEEASVVARRHEEPLPLAKALRHMAELKREENDLDLAERLYGQALALYQANGSPVLDVANTHRGLALLHEARGNMDAAIEAWESAQEGYRACGVESGAAEAAIRLRKR